MLLVLSCLLGSPVAQGMDKKASSSQRDEYFKRLPGEPNKYLTSLPNELNVIVFSYLPLSAFKLDFGIIFGLFKALPAILDCRKGTKRSEDWGDIDDPNSTISWYHLILASCKQKPFHLKLYNKWAIDPKKHFDGCVKLITVIQPQFDDTKRFIDECFGGVVLDLAKTEIEVNFFEKLVRLDHLWSLNLYDCSVISNENDRDATEPEDILERDKIAMNKIQAITECEYLKELNLSYIYSDVKKLSELKIFSSDRLQKSVRILNLTGHDGKDGHASVRDWIPFLSQFKLLKVLILTRTDIDAKSLDQLVPSLSNLREIILEHCCLDSLTFVKNSAVRKMVLTNTRLTQKMLTDINIESVKKHLKEIVVPRILRYHNGTMSKIIFNWNQRKR